LDSKFNARTLNLNFPFDWEIMRKLWVVVARDSQGDIIYLKITERKKTAKRYLEECKEFFGKSCEIKMGEFYSLDEAETLNL